MEQGWIYQGANGSSGASTPAAAAAAVCAPAPLVSRLHGELHTYENALQNWHLFP